MEQIRPKGTVVRKIEPMIKTTSARQVRFHTTRYTPAINAMDIVVRATPNNGIANLRAVSTKWRSPNCAQIREIATMMELYIAMASQIRNVWNVRFITKVAMPWWFCGSELLYPPGIVKPAAKVTVATSVDTNKSVNPVFVFLRDQSFTCI